eukprot:SAG22_NODE_1318_length_4763_cov_18.825472_6_plen_228_part_00
MYNVYKLQVRAWAERCTATSGSLPCPLFPQACGGSGGSASARMLPAPAVAPVAAPSAGGCRSGGLRRTVTRLAPGDVFGSLSELAAGGGCLDACALWWRPLWFHPEDDPFRRGWDAALLGLMLYLAIVIPLRVGFAVPQPVGSTGWWVDLAVDVFFTLDIALNFRTGFYDADHNLVMAPGKIRRVSSQALSALVVPLELCLRQCPSLPSLCPSVLSATCGAGSGWTC